jgi:putative ABC transport system permease protein
LAAVGIYGLLSYLVSQRTHEIGIRMAMGAQPQHILLTLIWQGGKIALTGTALGVGTALALTRLIASLLYGVSPTDPVTFAGVAILFITVALAACYIPARRAMKIDPMLALRHE